jgi:hypothetical protein
MGFSEEVVVVEVVAHAAIDNMTAARRNAERKCFRHLLKSLIFMACLLFQENVLSKELLTYYAQFSLFLGS